MGGWRKSSYSGGAGECAEVASWRVSSYSAACGNCLEAAAWQTSSCSANGACVDVGRSDAMVGIRDSRLGDRSPVLTFAGSDWTRFLRRIKADG